MDEELDALIRDLTKTMPIPVAKSYARKRVLEFLKAQKEEILRGLPKELTEADGWERCCPGDDVANGFNDCLTLVRDLINKT